MNKLIFALALLMAYPAYPQAANNSPAPIEVKGHVMGETLQVYLTKEGRETELNVCQSLAQNPNDKDTRKEAKKLKLPPQACKALLAGMNGSRVEIGMNGGGTFCGVGHCGGTFDGNHLVKVTMYVSDGFAVILPSLTSKYGKPVTTSTETAQNGYGAKFELGRALWNMPDGSVIIAMEDVNFSDYLGYVRSTDVTFATKEEAAKKETTTAKNPFDK